MNLAQIALEIERSSEPGHGLFHAGGAMIAPEPILEAIKEVTWLNPSQ